MSIPQFSAQIRLLIDSFLHIIRNVSNNRSVSIEEIARRSSRFIRVAAFQNDRNELIGIFEQELMAMGQNDGTDVNDRIPGTNNMSVSDRSPITTFQYTPEEVFQFKEIECCICLQKYEKDVLLVRRTRYQHVFHAECHDQWVAVSDICPLCKKR